MSIILVLVGAMIGAALFRGAEAGGGLLIGAGIGFLIARVTQLSERVRKLEQAPTASTRVPAPPAPAPAAIDIPARAIVPAPSEPISVPAAVRADAPGLVVSKLFALVRDGFSGGRAIPRVGIVILFFGVAFLLKYAAEHSLLPIELRLGSAAVAAMALLIIGWRLRGSRAVYGLTLQGGGIGVLYLTLFAAFRLYGLLPPAFTFTALALTAVLAGVLAVLQNAKILAVLGAAGGFLAPVLVSTGDGSHVALFSYYALLNLGILGIAWFRAWRELNVLGFVFTFAIGTLWGAGNYRPELFATTEPFLVAFFVFYVVIAVLFALRQPVNLRGYVDATLVFGVPVAAFALQAVLVRDRPYGLAASAVAVAAFYLVTASAIWQSRIGESRPVALRLLCEAFLALGVVFATLALPLALDGRWTSATWALEGAAMVWVGVRQQRLLARLFGVLLIFGAGIFFLNDLTRDTPGLPILNGIYLGTFMLAAASLFAANRLQHSPGGPLRAVESWLGSALFVWGLLWWVGGGLNEIDRQVSGMDRRLDAVVAFAAFSALLAEFIGARIAWSRLRDVALALLPVGLFLVVLTATVKLHPLTVSGVAAWAMFLLCHAVLLRRRDDSLAPGYRDFLHGATVWLIAALGAHECSWIGGQIASGSAWVLAGWGIGFGLAAAAAVSLPMPSPWRERRAAYVQLGAGPTLVVAGAWLAVANTTSNGDASPLPFVPLFNPLDLVSMFILACIAHTTLHARAYMARDTLRLVVAATGVLAFIWANAVLLRTLHYWSGIEFDAGIMLDAILVQASLSIFWTTLALIGMVAATRRHWRLLWKVGGALLVIVVGKLFIVDLARSGTLARIVSFIVVGVLLLLIGYLAPIPPAVRKEDTAS